MNQDCNSKKYGVLSKLMIFGFGIALVGTLSDSVLSFYLSQPTRALAVGVIVGATVTIYLFIFGQGVRQSSSKQSRDPIDSTFFRYDEDPEIE
ncbi:hypothetical protein AB1L42_23620 [Thalassoglobus sp. JC818]|uniref:hypothetical protein n=1 Tax=Thalassoglobus sp. JC818 TaxID=3232136 RepID=UPI003459D6B9